MQIIESDDFMTIDGKYQYDPKLAFAAGWWTFGEAFRRLRKYDRVVVANMFRTKDIMQGYIDEAAKHDIAVNIIRANSLIDPMDSWKRNQRGIPLEVFQRHMAEWEEFTKDEIIAFSKQGVFIGDWQRDHLGIRPETPNMICEDSGNQSR